ncbi:MAG: hypothetical protein WC752_01575 [Patescibacteria group bacterium]|jgi:hypothetical protein
MLGAQTQEREYRPKDDRGRSTERGYIDIEGLAEEAENNLEEIAEMAETFMAEHPDSPEVAELAGLIDEGDVLQETYWQRLGRILGTTEFQRAHWAKQLALPDNAYVIRSVQRRLRRGREKMLRSGASRDAEYSVALSMVLEASDDYHNAAKEDGNKWESIKQERALLLGRLFQHYLEKEETVTAISIWRHMPEEDRNRSANALVRCAIEKQKIKDLLPSPETSSNIEQFQKKVDAYNAYNSAVIMALANEPELIAVHESTKYNYFYRLAGDDNERWLLTQPRDFFQVMKTFPREQRDKIFKSAMRGQTFWPELFKEERGREVAEFLLEVAEDRRYSESDYSNIVRLVDQFPKEKRQALWPNIKPLFEKNIFSYNSGFYNELLVALKLAEYPEFSAADFSELQKGQLHYLGSVFFIYGEEKLKEEVGELHQAKDSTAGRYYDEYASSEAFIFTARATPAELRHLQAQYFYKGDPRELFYHVNALYRLILRLPGNHRDEVLNHLEPTSSSIVNRDYNQLTENQCLNFLEFSQEFPLCHITLQSLFEHADNFSAEKWPQIKQGAKFFAGLENIPFSASVTFFDNCAKAAQPENAEANGLLGKFSHGGTSWAREGRDGAGRYNAESAATLYQLAEYKRKIKPEYLQDPLTLELILDKYNLSSLQRKIFIDYFSGALASVDEDCPDWPVIAGTLLTFYPEDIKWNKDWDYIEKVHNLSGEQKRYLLAIEAKVGLAFGEQMYQMVVENKGSALFAFLEQFPDWQWAVTINELSLLTSRPDCYAWFGYFICKHYESISPDLKQTVIQRLIDLKGRCEARGYSLSGKPKGLNKYELEKFLSYDIEELTQAILIVTQTDIAKERDPLSVVLSCSEINDTPTFQRIMEFYAITGDFYYGYYDQTQLDSEQDQLDVYKQNTQTISNVLNRPLSLQERKKTAKLLPDVITFFISHQNYLEKYLESSISDFPAEATVLPGSILSNDFFWQLEMKSGSLESIAGFSPEKMQIFSQLLISVNFSREIYRLTGLTEVITKEQLQGLMRLHQTVGARLPYSIVEEHLNEIGTAESAEDLMKRIDEEGQNQQHRRGGEIAAWQIQRRRGILAPLQEKIPKAYDTILSDYLNPRWNDEESLALAEKITKLSPAELARLERLAEVCPTGTSCTENVLLWVSSPNFESLLPILQLSDRNFGYELLHAPEEQVRVFLDQLTPDFIERLKTIPDNVDYRLLEIMDFLALPQAPALFAMAREMPELSNKGKIILIDLLLLQPEQDEAVLVDIKKNAYLSVSSETMQMMMTATTDPAKKASLERITSTLSHDQKIDPSVLANLMNNCPENWRRKVLMSQIDRTGWAILAEHSLVEKAIQPETVDWEEVVKKLFHSTSNFSGHKYDLFATRIIMKNITSDHELIVAINSFQGEFAELWPSLFSRGDLLKQCLSSWQNLPEALLNHPPFWQYLMEQEPHLVIIHLEQKPATVMIQPERLVELTDQALDYVIESKQFLSVILQLYFSDKITADTKKINRVIDAAASQSSGWNNLVREMVNKRFNNYQKMEARPDNWVAMLSGFIATVDEDYRLPENGRDFFARSFGNEQQVYRDLCLSNFRKVYEDYLKDPDTLSPEIMILLKMIEANGGAGHLKYIGALGRMMNALYEAHSRETTQPATKKKIGVSLSKQEKRFAKERWTEEEKAAFYGISADILKVAPSLYTAYLDLMSELNPKEVKQYYKENFPLIQAYLITLQGSKNLEQELVAIRRNIKELKRQLTGNEDKKQRVPLLVADRQKMLTSIRERTKDRFHLLKIPEQWDEEKIRTMKNFLRYVGNMSNMTPEREKRLSFYFGLALNGEFAAFRRGEQVALAEYFPADLVPFYEQYLQQRTERNSLTPEGLGIAAEDMPEFQRLLQEEVVFQRLGNVETIDMKLSNLARNMEELGDEDAYPEETDKQVLRLYKSRGKIVGAVLAKIFQEASGRSVQLKPEEVEVKAALTEIFHVTEWTPDAVKRIQDGTKVFSLVANTLKIIENNKVGEEITVLQERLNPPDAVVDIFSRLGEEFRPQSGAMALTQDLSYLENIIAKAQDRLKPEERKIVGDYLNSIRAQMQKLEVIFSSLQEQLQALKTGVHTGNQPMLAGRVAEIEKVMHTETEGQTVYGRMTSDWNLIIENMRQCLGCQSKEMNNDTNLTFGDNNKFYLMTQLSLEKGSLSDELVLLLPTARADQPPQFSFVFDNVYGSKSADVLLTHLAAVTKKYNQIKRRFPDAKISLFITRAALSSVGLNDEVLRTRLQQSEVSYNSMESAEVTVTVPESASGDHYIEFGGGTRETGSRKVNGIILT